MQHLQPSMPDTHQKLLKWHQAGRLLSDQVSPPAGIFNFVLSSSRLANAHMHSSQPYSSSLTAGTPAQLHRDPHEGECPVCLWGLELKKGCLVFFKKRTATVHELPLELLFMYEGEFAFERDVLISVCLCGCSASICTEGRMHRLAFL